MNFFHKSNRKKIDKKQVELTFALDKTLSLIEDDIKVMTELFTNYKKYNTKSFDSFFHLCIYSSVTQADLIILLEKFRLTKRDYEKLLFARIIALTIIEYIDDINLMIGRDLIKELALNSLSEFKDYFKEISKKYSGVKKNNEVLLRKIRNNSMAHKSKNGLKLATAIYEIDSELIYKLGMEIFNITGFLTNQTTKVIYKLTEIAKRNNEN